MIAAVSHKVFSRAGVDDFVGKLAQGGIYVDVKSRADADALRARGIEVWRL